VISLDVEDLCCSLMIMTLCGPVRGYLRIEVHTAPFVSVDFSNNLVSTYIMSRWC